MKKRLTKTEITALSIAVMCCERSPELYTSEFISNIKEKYSNNLKIWREENPIKSPIKSKIK